MDSKIFVIDEKKIKDLDISPKLCVDWVREAFFVKDNAQLPAKLSVHPQGEDFITTMPCLLPNNAEERFFGVKVVSRIEGQVPCLNSEIFLYNSKTGKLKAIIDGNWITAMRTGAVAALAAKTFQKSGTDTYSLLGLGSIAEATALCLIADNSNRKINFRLLKYKNQAELFKEHFRKYDNVTFEIIDNKTDFIRDADVVISCVTFAQELLFPNDCDYRPGITVIPVHTRGFQNCDLFFDKVFGDDTDQIRNFKYFSKFKKYSEFHKVLLGEIHGRESDEERILSYNYGIALHDMFFAANILNLLKKSNVDNNLLFETSLK